MTVQELITQLQQLDPSLMVTRPGYEGGIEEIHYFRQINLDLKVHRAWYYGPHEENENGTTGAVLLS